MALGVPRHISEMEMEKAFQMGCTLYFGFIYIYIYIYSFVNTVFHIHEKRKKKDE
jgi:flagellar biosynthesis protein FliP